MCLLHIFHPTPTVNAYLLFIHQFGIILWIYTLVNQSDKYNFWSFRAPFGFFTFQIPTKPLFMPTGYKILLQKFHVLRLNISHKVYDRNFTLNTL